MKKSLKFVQHLLKAKGRHGTHSPFVYTFVEQVLRKKNRRNRYKTTSLTIGSLSHKQTRLLDSTVAKLNPKKIILFTNLPLPIQETITSSHNNVELINLEELTSEDVDNSLIIADAATVLLLAEQAIFKQTVQKAVLFISPHQTPETERKWSQLHSQQQFNMTLDYWYFGLLLADPAFKIKQHFRLR